MFVGKVISSKDVTFTEQNRLGKDYDYKERHFRFVVNELLKGPKDSEIDINAGRTDSSCYAGFTVGKTYLVYASGIWQALYTEMCNRSSSIASAYSDLHFLRSLLKGTPEPRVYGSVTRTDPDLTKENSGRVTPMAGVRVVIEGNKQKFETVSDKGGLFSFINVPDGKYTIRPVLPDNYRAYYPASEEFVLTSNKKERHPAIHYGASAYLEFNIGWNNELSGKVLDSEGNPIIRAKVAIMVRRGDSPMLVHEERYDHRPQGKYSFLGLTPGKYLLAVKIRAPFTDPKKLFQFYYQQAEDLGQADEITIGESESLLERDIRLPPGYVVREIEGTVVWPNGVPVHHAWIFLAAAQDSADDDKKYDWESTDELGRFSLQAFVGATYWLHAAGPLSLEIPQKRSTAEPIKVTVGRVNEPLKIVVPFPKTPEP